MNFLQLCKEMASDSGTVAGVPNLTTIVGSTGRVAQCVNWVRNAWIDIQNEREDWSWMRRRFTGKILTINQTEYDADADFSLPRVAEWLPDRPAFRTFSLYDPGIGPGDEGDITQISYDRWVSMYGRSTHDAQRPQYWAVSPTGALMLGPKPDKVYALSGEYRLTPQELQADTDVPEMPKQYHRLIVAEAIRLAARSDEAWPAMQAQGDQYTRLRNALVNSQTGTPNMTGFFA